MSAHLHLHRIAGGRCRVRTVARYARSHVHGKGNPKLRHRRCVATFQRNVGAAAPRTPPSRECATLHHHSLELATGNTRGGNVCDAKRLTKWRTVHLSNRSAQTDSNKHDARPASVVGLKKQASQSSFFNDSSHSEMRSQKFMSWKSNRIILDHWDSLSRMAGVIHRCNARSRQHPKKEGKRRKKKKKKKGRTEEYRRSTTRSWRRNGGWHGHAPAVWTSAVLAWVRSPLTTCLRARNRQASTALQRLLLPGSQTRGR